MFIIVPKYRKDTAASAPQKQPTAEEKEPVRIGVACDPCRVKKTKVESMFYLSLTNSIPCESQTC